MKCLRHAQRVVVNSPYQMHAGLAGRAGTVVRALLSGDGAWVRMDEPIHGLAAFCDEARKNWVRLWPEECSPKTKKGGGR